MGRFAWMGAALAVCAGCGSSGQITPFGDAGPDGALVYLDGGGGGPATVPPNGVAACPAGICNYQAGTGCTGTMTSCLPSVTGTQAKPACFTPGMIPSGGACTQSGDCVAGHICASGTCRKLCCGGDWTGCDSPSEHCLQTLAYGVDAGVVNTGAMLCYTIDNCNVLEPSSCTTPGTACLLADPTGAAACLPPGSGTAGEACPCAGGYTCVTPPNAKGPVCIRLCKAVAGGGAPYCQNNEGACTHFTRDPPGVGECQPPMP
jgi:hypothetical protein